MKEILGVEEIIDDLWLMDVNELLTIQRKVDIYRKENCIIDKIEMPFKMEQVVEDFYGEYACAIVNFKVYRDESGEFLYNTPIKMEISLFSSDNNG